MLGAMQSLSTIVVKEVSLVTFARFLFFFPAFGSTYRRRWGGNEEVEDIL